MRRSKKVSTILGMVMGAMLAVGIGFVANPMDANAETTIVKGVVKDGTTANVLNLSTPEGDMSIKIDSNADMSGCHMLLTGSSVTATVYYSNADSYMHTNKLSNTNITTTTTGSTPVVGQISDKAISNNTIVLSTISGDLYVKFDSATDFSGASVLTAKKYVIMNLVRESDGTYRAVSVKDYDSSSSSQSNSNSNTAATTNTTTTTTTNTATTDTTASTVTVNNPPANTTPVTGTIDAKSSGNNLFLTTKDGTYDLLLDSNTDYTNGYMMIAGAKITVNIYYKSEDAHMHVASVTRTGELTKPSTASSNTAVNYTGTVDAKSTDSNLYLTTSGGTMTIKLDPNTKLYGNNPVRKGSTVTVSCVQCADEFWHATLITVK